MTFHWIEQKRSYRRYQTRVEALPLGHRSAVVALQRYYTHLGGMSDGDSILEMLDDLADLFEQAAADGTPVRAIVGDDPLEFADAFLRNYPAGRWIARERERLIDAIDRAAAAGTDGPGASG